MGKIGVLALGHCSEEHQGAGLPCSHIIYTTGKVFERFSHSVVDGDGDIRSHRYWKLYDTD